MENDKIINIDGNWINPDYIVSLQPALTYPNYETDPTKTLLELEWYFTEDDDEVSYETELIETRKKYQKIFKQQKEKLGRIKS